MEFNNKIVSGNNVVFDCDEDDLQWVSLLFIEDGLEAFNAKALLLEDIDHFRKCIITKVINTFLVIRKANRRARHADTADDLEWVSGIGPGSVIRKALYIMFYWCIILDNL